MHRNQKQRHTKTVTGVPFSSCPHSLPHTCDCNSPADAEPVLANCPCAGHVVSVDCVAGMGDVLATQDQLPTALLFWLQGILPEDTGLTESQAGLGDFVLSKRL